MKPGIIASACGALLCVAAFTHAQVPQEDLQKIRDAAPGEASGKPAKPRRVLIFSSCPGFKHESIPWGVAALRILGEKSGAYEPVVSDDPAVFEKESLKGFGAVVFNNNCGDAIPEQRHRDNLLAFVHDGGGFVAIHCGSDAKWEGYGEMLGASAINHPWNADETATIRVEEPSHPVVKSFGGDRVVLNEEIYQYDDRFSRRHLRVLLSLDTSSVDVTRPAVKRTDGDFALAWVKGYGKGRVFVTALGHNKHVYWDPRVLAHYLAGIQFAMGDLPADAEPPDESESK